MKRSTHALIFGSLVALGSASALADHNSPHGAGWANMPNDVHNTRIEDGLSGQEFSAFVRQGGGADSVNRYLDTATTSRGGGAATASRSGGGGGGRR